MNEEPILKMYRQRLFLHLSAANLEFEREKCDIIAGAIVKAVYESHNMLYKDILNGGFDTDLANYGLDEIDTAELVLDAEMHLFNARADVPDDFLNEFDGDAGNNLLQITEYLYRAAFQ